MIRDLGKDKPSRRETTAMEQAMRNEERARALRISSLMDRKPPARPKALQTYFSLVSSSKTKGAIRRPSSLKRA